MDKKSVWEQWISEHYGKNNTVEDGNAPAKDSSEASSDPYKIDYSDSKFADVESAKTEALSKLDSTYGEMTGKSDSFYNEQIQAAKDWEEQQKQLQQEQTDFAIDQIEQQKDQAKEDYTKEQSGAYSDWQKQTNQYGVNAEKMASQGMSDTGYSESSKVSMYNAYQARVSAAREAFARATLDYDNAIKEAQLQNNSVMAQLAFESYQKRLELALAGFQYKNQLILDQTNKKLEVESLYYQRWQDVLAQMNTENALAEQIRQFNESMALEREQFEFQVAQQTGSGYSGGGGGSGTISYNTWLANLSNRDRAAYEAAQNKQPTSSSSNQNLFGTIQSAPIKSATQYGSGAIDLDK